MNWKNEKGLIHALSLSHFLSSFPFRVIQKLNKFIIFLQFCWEQIIYPTPRALTQINNFLDFFVPKRRRRKWNEWIVEMNENIVTLNVIMVQEQSPILQKKKRQQKVCVRQINYQSPPLLFTRDNRRDKCCHKELPNTNISIVTNGYGHTFLQHNITNVNKRNL